MFSFSDHDSRLIFIHSSHFPRTIRVTQKLLIVLSLLVGNVSISRVHSYEFNEEVNVTANESHFAIEHATPGEWTFLRDGQTVTKLIERSGGKPILWPLMGPDGVELTRSYPMTKVKPGEAEDHVHHRSLWFTHGEVNGIDFWAEGEGRGVTKQLSVEILKAGPSKAALRTTNDWLAPDGTQVLSDIRTITVSEDAGNTAIDFDLQLNAAYGPVHFGDTKEGSFGVRVAGPMGVDSKQGGMIVNSRGDVDGATWGKKAEWVDYTGPVTVSSKPDAGPTSVSNAASKTYGIAILNHPSSFAYPTRWHVRTYGLFAANPFGVYHFDGGEATTGVHLAVGESITLRYRLLLHTGTTDDAKIAEAWERYRAMP